MTVAAPISIPFTIQDQISGKIAFFNGFLIVPVIASSALYWMDFIW